jgi:hypothetical protein
MSTEGPMEKHTQPRQSAEERPESLEDLAEDLEPTPEETEALKGGSVNTSRYDPYKTYRF